MRLTLKYNRRKAIAIPGTRLTSFSQFCHVRYGVSVNSQQRAMLKLQSSLKLFNVFALFSTFFIIYPFQ